MVITAIIKNVSRRLARESNITGVAGRDEEVFSYALVILLLNVTALIFITLLSWMLGTLKFALTILLAFFAFRIFTGGRHQPGPVTCFLTTVIVFTFLGYIIAFLMPRIINYVSFIAIMGLIIAMYAAIFHAPVTAASKQFSRAKRRKLKSAAIGILALWATIVLGIIPIITAEPDVTLGITAGLVVQALSILPLKIRKRKHNR